MKRRRIHTYLYWAPRILGIIFILFLMLFSLDVFELGRSVGQIVVALIMHNLPALFLSGALALGWKNELIGGITFIFIGVLALIFSLPLIIVAPAVLVGLLFLLSYVMLQKELFLLEH